MSKDTTESNPYAENRKNAELRLQEYLKMLQFYYTLHTHEIVDIIKINLQLWEIFEENEK